MRLCFYSISDGVYSDMVEILASSLKKHNKYEFIAFADRFINNVDSTIKLPQHLKGKDLWFYKIDALSILKQHKEFDYFILLDADTYCIKNFKLDHLIKYPCFAIFGEDLKKHNKNWWDKSPNEISNIFGTLEPRHISGGFFGGCRDYVDHFLNLYNCSIKVWSPSEEPNIAYSVYKSCDISSMIYHKNFDTYAIADYDQLNANDILNGKPWIYKTWITKSEYTVNPALIHFAIHKDKILNFKKSHQYSTQYKCKYKYKHAL